MGYNYELSADENIEVYSKIIENLGITLKFGSNVWDFEELVNNQPERHPLSPSFDPLRGASDCEELLWLVGFDSKGELVATQAIKLLDTGDDKLFEYFTGRIKQFHPLGYEPDITDAQVFLSDDAKKIGGRITYHGELWLKGGSNGVRGGCLSTVFTRLLLLTVLKKWSPEYFIGIQWPKVACTGLSIKESYCRMEQRSLVWYKQSNDELIEQWLVWMTAKEAEFNLRIPAMYFVEIFEEDSALKRQVLAQVA